MAWSLGRAEVKRTRSGVGVGDTTYGPHASDLPGRKGNRKIEADIADKAYRATPLLETDHED